MQKKAIAGNMATGWLKIIALVFMMCDHMGKMIFPHIPEMRILGRIAFPIYAWCLVVGACHTRCMWKYMLRIGVIGLISQPLYMVALNHTWREPNIFLTLLVALLGLWGLRERKWLSHIWAPALALVLAVTLRVDYGWKGVLLVLLLYAARNSRSALAAVMVAFCLYWGSGSGAVTSFFGLRLSTPVRELNTLLQPWLRLQGLAILSLPFMLWRCPWKLKLPAWVGYGLYPAHLVVLWVLTRLAA